MENCKKESAHKVAKRNARKTPLKPRLRTSIFQLSPGNRLLRIEQSGVASSTRLPPNLKQRESVKLKGKRKERKARAKGPSSDSAQSEFTCSICNRQFRAKIGLYSHQRTHKHTLTPNIQELRWSFSVMRDEQSKLCLVSPFIIPANRDPGVQIGHTPGASLSAIGL